MVPVDAVGGLGVHDSEGLDQSNSSSVHGSSNHNRHARPGTCAMSSSAPVASESTGDDEMIQAAIQRSVCTTQTRRETTKGR
mmetsp:Transcript_51831/g.77389  ORF Transcript_51831/g.77389 Transcript_51831/m.77389 type:complete len:82 (+) Transcript_51831:1238-1483(+)|eukprot:CAMPEP_0194070326 /NCGR_PEP_ID=MMETSP0009_2-20130614/88120_1 /TAXON_ID=210454 /ORGANISM="Grammatophora oceanica, Strain CCMP 410" /LENGTH=81 /DNA_ID=CAMNT_0038723591 /DNA_START=1279 /DNA_END=1524 /DNA_ORIENTATION=-